MKLKYISGLSIVLLLTLELNCSNPTSLAPPSQEMPKAVKLKLIDVSCTEAFINITASDTFLPVNITLNKDEKALFNFTLTKTDTTLIDTTLQASKTYIYQTNEIIKGITENSDTLQVKSLDTTSNNFTWQTFTFGDPGVGSSEINDVAIISEDDIWCVGEINVSDSSENGYTTYNAVHWNGSKWELKKISTEFRGSQVTVSLEGIFAFSPTDIWMVGSLPIHGDGKDWTMYDVRTTTDLNLSLSKAWGSSSNNMYFVGRTGSIAHYQNGNWSKIESGTTSNIADIYGYTEPISGAIKILATVTEINNYKILSLTSYSAKDTLNWPINKSLSGIWLNRSTTYAGGADIWINKNSMWKQVTSTGYFFTRVRGTKCNNIYGIGPDGTVHFNGSTWQIIKPRPEGMVIVSGDCRSNKVILVGFASSGGVVGKAVVIIGTQIN